MSRPPWTSCSRTAAPRSSAVNARAHATWDDFVAPLEDANERLGRAWGQVAHLNAVIDSPALREAYNANLPKVTQYWTELGQNQRSSRGTRRSRARRRSPRLSRGAQEDRRERAARFPPRRRRAAAGEEGALRRDPGGAREAVERVLGKRARRDQRLLALRRRRSAIAGIPHDVLAGGARGRAEKDGKPGWKFTLHMPSYLPVLQYADDRGAARDAVPRYVTRASEFGKPEWDNTPLIARIVELRRETRSCSATPTSPKCRSCRRWRSRRRRCSRSSTTSRGRARPVRREATSRSCAPSRAPSSASTELRGLGRRLRVREAAREALRVLGPGSEAVLPRGSRAAGHVPRRRDALRRAHPRREGAGLAPGRALLRDPRRSAGSLVGQFYLDLYARDTKRGGAWMDDAITRRRKGARACRRRSRTSTATSPRPSGGKPALFTHDEVITLFHEFGHGLHHLLTRVDELGVSGINGVEWDAVELPSQFMENFCWEWDVLRAHDRARRHRRSRCRASCSTRCSPRRTSRAACRCCARSSSRCSTCACTPRSRRAPRTQLLDEVRDAGRGADAARLQPLPEQLLAHLRRRLRGGLLQLQMGGSAVGGRLLLLRGERRARSARRRSASATRSSPSAAAGPLRNRSAPSAAASRASMRC